jgi:hypothetical protein
MTIPANAVEAVARTAMQAVVRRALDERIIGVLHSCCCGLPTVGSRGGRETLPFNGSRANGDAGNTSNLSCQLLVVSCQLVAFNRQLSEKARRHGGTKELL